eukprot:EG_transcript_5589
MYGTASALTQTATGSKTTYAVLTYFDSELVAPDMGTADVALSTIQKLQNNVNVTWNDFGSYKDPSAYYNSPFIHSVPLSGLTAGVQYSYQVSGDNRVFSFTMPSDAKLPLKIGMVADVGQTPVSNSTLRAVASYNPDLILLAGDLSYADGWGWRWDSFGRLFEIAGAWYPFLTCPGNHEVAESEQYQHYTVRFPMPHSRTGSTDNTWFSYEVGPVHIISLNSYSATGAGSAQYNWLVQDLATIRRSTTPWVLVMFHTPWYNTNTFHSGEAQTMKSDVETLMFNAGVDIVMSGHVHSYERTFPMYQGAINPCGPTYLNVGDGGNREGAARPWTTPQASWSAFREASFGAGLLTVYNATHAFFQWDRHACESPTSVINFSSTCQTTGDNSGTPLVTSDSVWIVRNPSACSNRNVTGTGARWAGTLPAASPSPNPSPAPTDVGLSIAALIAAVFGAISLLLLAILMWMWHDRRKARPFSKNVMDV